MCLRRSPILLLCLVFFVSGVYAQNDTTWFADDWSVTVRENASFFRPQPQKTADGYTIRDFYRSGFLQMEGNYRDADAVVRHGAFRFHKDNSTTISSTEYYNNSKPVGEWVSYDTVSGLPRSKAIYGEDTSTRTIEIYYPDGKVMETGTLRSAGRTGQWKGLYRDGKVAWTTEYEEGKMHGKRFRYDSSTGAVVERGEKIRGVETGVFEKFKPGSDKPYMVVTIDPKNPLRAVKRLYDTTSILMSETEMYDHKRSGKHTVYFPDGTVMAAATFRDDRKEGPGKVFRPTGKLMTSGNFLDDGRDGEWKYFNEEGLLSSVQHYKSDKQDGPALYYEPGTKKLKAAGQHEDGERAGEWKFFIYSGTSPSHIENYRNGKLHGRYAAHNKTGLLILEGAYEDGERTGKWKYYTSSTGKFFLEKYYVLGRLHGVLNAYAPDRSLVRTATYVRGKLDSERCIGRTGVDTACKSRWQPIRYDSSYQSVFSKTRGQKIENLLSEKPDTVAVRIWVSVYGTIFWPKVMQSTNPELNEEAERLAMTLQIYQPALELDEPVQEALTIPIIFAAKRKPED